jgi:hypothetical protein
LFLGLLLVVEAELIQLVDEIVGLLDIDVLKLSVVAAGGDFVIIGELKQLVLQF